MPTRNSGSGLVNAGNLVIAITPLALRHEQRVGGETLWPDAETGYALCSAPDSETRLLAVRIVLVSIRTPWFGLARARVPYLRVEGAVG